MGANSNQIAIVRDVVTLSFFQRGLTMALHLSSGQFGAGRRVEVSSKLAQQWVQQGAWVTRWALRPRDPGQVHGSV